MIALENETSVRVKAGTAVEIACVSGVLWVTQEGDVRDMFLAPGESLRLAGRGLTIVTALEPSLVRLIEDAKPSVGSGRVVACVSLGACGDRCVTAAIQRRAAHAVAQALRFAAVSPSVSMTIR
jgi:hypothetical protein